MNATNTASTQNGHNTTNGARPARQNTAGNHPRLSRPVELMKHTYDVVVIGSGYGGGVAASRMARGRQSVCMLEVGNERWPGEFPEKVGDVLKELHVTGEFAPGDRRGKEGRVIGSCDPTKLYHVVVGDGQNAFVGNGLGGTSLLNANVFLEAHPKVLNMEVWPPELRGHEAWAKYYQRAKDVLEPAKYPADHPELLKLSLLEQQANAMGWGKNFYRVPQTTRFADGFNSTGVKMKASTSTGMDATGINDGSKSTTLVTYLADAWNWGAEIFCECEVRHVEKAPDREGYIVYFAWHGSKRGEFEDLFYEDLMWVHAKKFVFLGAGSLGSTEILLRSRQMGLDISDDVGTEMSGNGDMLAFGYNTDYDANAIASPKPPPGRPVGPCITGVIDLRDQENVLDGFVIEDAAVPLALAPILFPLFEKLPGQIRSDPKGVADFIAKTTSRIGGKIAGPFFKHGSIQKTAVYLIMSHDSSQARLILKHDKPILRYSGVGRSDSVSRINELLSEMTAKVGGTFVPNPAQSVLGQQQITVHPIGGARISKDGTGKYGVVNDTGEVFIGDTAEVHSGLVVCDGSIVPAAVGVNPFATITALAERSVELLALKHGIKINYDTRNGVLDLFGKPEFPITVDDTEEHTSSTQKAGFSFTEIMSGFIHGGGKVKSFDTAEKIARGRSEAARVYLSVNTDDLARMLRDKNHVAALTGTFTCPSLGGPFMIRRGRFQLFSVDPRRADTKNFVYDFNMISPSGRILHFNGYKDVGPATAFNLLQLWRSTTTLFTTITETDGSVIGRGILKIHPNELVDEVQTIESQAPSFLGRAASSASFLSFFAAESVSKLLGPLALRPKTPPLSVEAYNFAATEPNQTFRILAKDNVASDLLLWNAASENESTSQILFVPGAAVDHQIFALPTIEINAIEYFREAGYRTYCLNHRIGIGSEAKKGHTTYGARLDITAALEHIRRLDTQAYGQPRKIYIIAHCAGSAALSIGLLDGTIPADWISGITASNVFMHPRFAKTNYILASMPIALTTVYENLAGTWYDCSSGIKDNIVQRFLTNALKVYPVGSADETCTSDVCHRSSLVFGRLWSHKDLNAATHTHLARFLGGTTMKSLSHLMAMGVDARVMTDDPKPVNLVTPQNIARLKGIPILFISGAENTVFVPESTDMSYTTLCTAHGREWYEREVFEGRGHLDCWMGATAFKDVYPRVRNHVRMVTKSVETTRVLSVGQTSVVADTPKFKVNVEVREIREMVA